MVSCLVEAPLRLSYLVQGDVAGNSGVPHDDCFAGVKLVVDQIEKSTLKKLLRMTLICAL